MTDLELGPLAPADVRPLARLHAVAFPGFFLSTLGEPFLVELYRGFLGDRSAVTVVARTRTGRVAGAAVGTVEPAGYFRRLLLRRWPGFARASLAAVVRHPGTAPRLIRAVRYRGGATGGDEGALLSSIYVVPEVQGTGLGRRLLEEWTRQARLRGATAAFLTTDSDANEAVNAFYAGQGWTLADHYRTPEGRAMNRYTKRLDTA